MRELLRGFVALPSRCPYVLLLLLLLFRITDEYLSELDSLWS